MSRKIKIILILIIVVVIGWVLSIKRSKLLPNSGPNPLPTASPTNSQRPISDLIQVVSPQPNEIIDSSGFLTISGQARGSWYFEAVFPIKLFDANGNVLVAGQAHTIADWMTDNFVPFTAELHFSTPVTTTGTLVLQNDNPSGLPQNEKTITIPLRFSATASPVIQP